MSKKVLILSGSPRKGGFRYAKFPVRFRNLDDFFVSWAESTFFGEQTTPTDRSRGRFFRQSEPGTDGVRPSNFTTWSRSDQTFFLFSGV